MDDEDRRLIEGMVRGMPVEDREDLLGRFSAMLGLEGTIRSASPDAALLGVVRTIVQQGYDASAKVASDLSTALMMLDRMLDK